MKIIAKNQLDGIMSNFLLDNWELLTGAVSSVVAFFGGRKTQKTNELASMQQTYNTWVEDQKERYNDLKIEMQDLKNHNRELQKQFNEMQLAYAKEVEASQNWQILHNELEKKYKELEKLYEKLKKDFDTYKKNNTIK